MAEWLRFEIPDSLIGERREQKSRYVTTYQTEILLPKSSEYAGYHFWHPSKLVSELGNGTTAITYNSTFSFTLVKKEREPGKRYKRHVLSVDELLVVYAPEVAKVTASREKKESARRAQEGTVEVVIWPCSYGPDTVRILFHFGKRYFVRNGNVYGPEKNACKCVVIAEGITQGAFEDADEDLTALQEAYQMIQDMRNTVGRYQSDKVADIGESFIELCDKLDEELLLRAKDLFKRSNEIQVRGKAAEMNK